MPASKITLHLDYMANHETILVEHDEDATIQIFDMAVTAGGSERMFQIQYAVIEAASKAEIKKFEGSEDAHLSRRPHD